MIDDDVAAEIAALQRAYREALPPKIEALERALSERSPEAILLAHRLRGTSGSYGLETISAHAGAIEDALERDDRAAALAHLAALKEAL